jgi:putative ABC transport system substrate-binding protein
VAARGARAATGDAGDWTPQKYVGCRFLAHCRVVSPGPEGRNVAIEYRWADNQLDRLPELAADLLRRQVAVIVGNSVSVRAAMAATATTPIVFVVGNDPVRIGLVPSLNRPGGNVTGVVFDTILAAKRLGLLHELVPRAALVALLVDPTFPDSEFELSDAEAAAGAIGRRILITKAANEREINTAFTTILQAGAGGLLVGSGPILTGQRRLLAALSLRHALPACYVTRDFPEAGGLISYGPSQPDAYRRAGNYVGRILKGAKPADLPVDQATKFELVINLATTKAFGLAIPLTLLALADEVIE